MSNYRVAQRYATALLESADEKGLLEEVAHDAEAIGKTIRENRELRLLLSSPIIQKEKKKGILGELFAKNIQTLTLKFLDLLIEKDREGDLLDILDQFLRLLDAKRGIIRVEVASAVDLTEEQKKELQKKLTVYTGKQVEPSFRLDPTLLGGFLVRLDDRIINASLAHQLEVLREKFLEGTYARK